MNWRAVAPIFSGQSLLGFPELVSGKALIGSAICGRRKPGYCDVIRVKALMKVINSVIVNPLITPGRGKIPHHRRPNQRYLTHFSSRRAVKERGEQVESPQALCHSERSADPV
ncbi:hypothetical protein KCP73_16235 [Salmonella enterica subsp. enterica]|nr:hypothetical protein KCP73_16235 [Salmonella enterica subsp. enterica]